MKKLRLGIIGCGGRFNAHLNGLLQLDNAEIVAVADPIEERRIAAGKNTGAKKIYHDHTDLYNNESRDTLDAVMIFIEPTAHTDTETRAIDMGLHFFIEKPMTMDLELADTVLKKSEEKGLITSVGFQDRYLDLIDIIKAELPKHKQGGLVYGAWVGGIPGVWWWQKKSTCGGQLVEQNIHLLDGLRYLYGEPLSVYATCSRGMVVPGVDASPEYDTDDHSTAVIRFKNNVTATLVSGCYSKTVRPNCGYVITLDDMILDYRLRNNLIITTQTVTRDIKRSMDQTFALDQAFVQAVLTGDRSLIRSPYGDALKSLKLAFAANKSMETGEVIYF
ncbi:Gfo/Idh/MocA family protein [Congzhengia minquanensis]|uniref:Gfo/Idh/MocA family oxidoreductase n=1 Tax=Congzhengia minquanensis TaxID=2763657 RepID=A0A926HXU6_9FIRM|nr:Gfo/Idh/MocA family oxidoreductase [Congzhengia minquanensis]MBC8539733.1 Gfo/Idh/MocA family oxidoreductase [Congzhengia minquanensis]